LKVIIVSLRGVVVDQKTIVTRSKLVINRMEEKMIGAVSADDFAARSFSNAGRGSKSAAGRIPTRPDPASFQMFDH
jgi:hypothetical protein